VKESTFISNNEADWHQLEDLLKQQQKDADKLLHLFEKVSADLAYARTYYPNRSIRIYLNNLTQEVLNTLVKKRKRFQLAEVFDFYKTELPAEIYRSRKAFYVSFLVFAIAVLIGVVSSAHVDDFANVVLGDEYVAMTDKNINKGDPMAVYKDMDQGDMFMRITINNIKVSFLCFVMGLLSSLGTIIILLSNGIMVGAFQYYFYKKGLFLTSFLTIWIHGTIEISSIILAGAAGIILGNGLMFPKSYSREASLLLSAKRALRVILAIMPLFVIAGFLESFVTRLTEMPMIVKVLIIMVSLFLILGVFVVYPIYCARHGLLQTDRLYESPVKVENLKLEKYTYKNFNKVLASTFAELRLMFGSFLSQMLVPAFVMMCIVSYLFLKFRIVSKLGLSERMRFSSFESGAWPYGLTLILLTAFLFVWLILKSQSKVISGIEYLKGLKAYFLKVLPIAVVFCLGYFYGFNNYLFLLLLLIPIHFLFILLEEIVQNKSITIGLVGDKFLFSLKYWFDFLAVTLFAIGFVLLMKTVANTQFFSIVIDFVGWHSIFDNSYADKIFVTNLVDFIMYFCSVPFLFYAYTYKYGASLSLAEAVDLKDDLKLFGTVKNTYLLQR